MAVHSEDFAILACVVLTQYRSVTDGQTDRRTNASMMAKTRVALLSRVKTLKNICASDSENRGGKCKQCAIIFQGRQVIVNFVSKYVAMATGVGRGEI